MEIRREQVMILDIDGEADVGVCRRKAVALSQHIGFDEVKVGEVAILVSELVTNVLKHGGRKGRILACQLIDKEDRKALEIWCCDSGEGISNPNQAFQDGFTQKQTLGIGLGTIRRFSDVFDIAPERDEMIYSLLPEVRECCRHCLRVLKWLPEKQWRGSNRGLMTGASSRSLPGEVLNGDAFVIVHLNSSRTVAAVIDGLGHGKDAHLASSIIKEQLLLKIDLPLADLVQYLHQASRGTRGAVIGLTLIDIEKEKLWFVGIGNIEGFVISESGKKSLISFGGILGHQIRTPRVYELAFLKNDTLCLYSDGIHSRWNVQDLDWSIHPQKITEFIIQHYSRLNDDATVLIINRTV